MAKILVIDDEQRVLDYFRALLTKLGHEPVLARDGDEGCQLLERDREIAMVFADFCMPGNLSEISLVRHIRALRPDLPLVVISGYPDDETLAECTALGVRDFLSKPFELSFVASVIQKSLNEGKGTPA